MTQPLTLTSSLTYTANLNNQLKNIEVLFDIIKSDSLSMQADITDHYVEDNTAVQDTMAIKPIEITLSGFVAEKVYDRSLMVTGAIENAFSKIAPISALIPPISSYANVVVNASRYVESSINRYINSFKNIKDIFNKNKSTPASKQEQVYQALRDLRDNRTIVTVKTPYGTFDNMLIQDVHIEQGDSTSVSDLNVTVKEYNSVATQLVNVNTKKYAGRVAQQKAITENLGKVQGKQELVSTLYRTFIGN